MNQPTPDRFQQEEAMRRMARLPPGQALTLRFPVLHYGAVPGFNPESWDFRIWGEVEEPLTLTWEEFSRLPQTALKMDIHCVTRWSMFDTEWEGVTMQTLISAGLLKVKKDAHFVVQHAEYGFTSNLPLAVVMQENFLLATHFRGQPLSPEHGYPLRGVIGQIPGREDLKTPYFWKGAKWLRGLEFLSEDKPGFWEQAGYHNEGDIWKEQRIA